MTRMGGAWVLHGVHLAGRGMRAQQRAVAERRRCRAWRAPGGAPGC